MRSATAAPRGRAKAWLLLLGSSVLYFFSINTADNDLWGHLLFGRTILARGAIPRVDTFSYTAAGFPWMNHEWLSQVLLATIYRWAGASGLLFLKMVLAAATVSLLISVIRRRSATPDIWGAVTLLTIALLARGFALRPQMFTYCGIALTLLLLDRFQRSHRHALWWLPPLFLLWANLHGGFVLGLAILGLFACAETLCRGTQSWRVWLVWLTSVALTMINPYGPHLLVYVWGELSRSHPISEWQPVSPTDVSQFVFFAMLGLFVLTVPFVRRWRAAGWEVALALIVGVLAVRHQRHTPVFALCAAAPLTLQLQNAAAWASKRSAFALGRASRSLIAAAMIVLACVQLGFVGLRYRRDDLRIVFDPKEYPTRAVRALRTLDVPINLAVPLDWGEYVLWFLAPQVKVSLDGRFATLYPQRVVTDNFNFFSGGADWGRLLQRYPTQAALVPVGSACPVSTFPGWQLVLSTPVALLYARVDSRPWRQLKQLSETAPPPARPGIFP